MFDQEKIEATQNIYTVFTSSNNFWIKIYVLEKFLFTVLRIIGVATAQKHELFFLFHNFVTAITWIPLIDACNHLIWNIKCILNTG
jgi:hypothetical protein